MKKNHFILTVLFFLIVLTGCNANTESTSFKGLIYAVEDGRILVVQDIDSVQVPYDEWFAAGNNAIWFSFDEAVIRDASGKKVAPNQIKTGQNAEVLFSGAIAKSYPGQASADEIKIVDSK